ncbi:MAG: T9SS type A sorting domain-containing protein, partial [Flavobacteriales bacterium]
MRVLFLLFLLGVGMLHAQFVPEKSTFFGGLNFDYFTMVADSPDGGVYCGGSAYSSGLATPGAFQPLNGGQDDAIICRFDASLNLVWCSYFGSSEGESVAGMTVLTDGSIVVVGFTNSPSGLYYSGGLPFQSGDSYVLRMAPDGSRIWSSFFFDGAIIQDVSAHPSGDMIIVGYAQDFSSLASEGSQQMISGGNGDGFITRVTPQGSIVWSRYFGGPEEDALYSVRCKGDSIYAVGSTVSESTIAYNCEEGCEFFGGGRDALVFAMNSNGDVLHSRYFGGEGDDSFYELDLNEEHVLITGRTTSNNGISLGEFAWDSANTDNFPSFVALMDSNLDVLWSTYIHDSSSSFPTSASIDQVGRCWLTLRVGGDNSNCSGDTGFAGGFWDGMVLGFHSDGEVFSCGYVPAGTLNDQASAILTTSDKIFLAGYTFSPEITVSEDAWQTEFAGQSDAILMRFALPVGVDEMADLSVSPVYPNPAVDQLTIPASAMTGVQELHVYDLAGRSVLHQSAHLPGVATLHITSLQPGMYTIRAHNAAGQAVWVQRWVKG